MVVMPIIGTVYVLLEAISDVLAWSRCLCPLAWEDPFTDTLQRLQLIL